MPTKQIRSIPGRSERRWSGAILGALAGVCIAFTPNQSATAADGEGRFAVKGAARTLCEHFISARDRREKDVRSYLAYVAWMEGYLTAINERTSGLYDLTAYETTELLATLIYGNCKRKPDSKFFNVVRSMVEVLGTTRLQAYSKLIEVKGTVNDVKGNPQDVTLPLYQETLRRAQIELRKKGYYSGSIDGQFGPKMRTGFEAFQDATQLPKTGLPDQLTLLRLFRGEEAN